MMTQSAFHHIGGDLKFCNVARSGSSVHAGRWKASLILTLVAYGLLHTGPAFASGSLPPTPITAGPFQNFDECLNHLESTARRQAAMAMPKPLKSSHGGTHQTILSSAGVVRGAGEQATYNSELGHVNRAINVKFHSIVTSYDWERYTLSCQGAVFTGSRQIGYASQGIEAIPPGKALVLPSK